jgi:AraC-like DNA-binding protein
LGEVIEHCADVGTAIAHLQQHYHLHDRGGMAIRTIEQQITSLGYVVFDVDSPSLEQIYDTAIAVGMVTMRYLCGPKWRATTVMLPRHRPDDVRPYRRVFGCTPEFNAERAALIFPTRDLNHRIAGADPEKYALLSERLQSVSSKHDLQFSDQVSRVVRGLIALHCCSMHQLSAELRMNERRINRLLEREGTTYQKIVQEALSTLAERLLVDTDMPIGKISAVLNYADASAFTRAFRKWHGCSPSDWRNTRTRQEQTCGI